MEIWAHRGAWRSPSEQNKITAFQRAMNQGCYGVELDVRLTRDSQLVISHDRKFSHRQETIDLAEHLLFHLINNKMVVDRIRDENGDPSRLPTLRLVLSLLLSKTRINVELKEHLSAISLMQLLGKMISGDCLNEDHLDKLLISSFLPQELVRVKTENPGIQTALLLGKTKPSWQVPMRKIFLKHYFKNNRIEAIHLGEGEIEDMEKAVAYFKELGLVVRVYTVNDPTMVDYYSQLGVAGIFTDQPELFSAHLIRPSFY